jgi:spore maturation protein CgeB
VKIVIAGDGHSEIHERACADALRGLGHDVVESYWAERFRRHLGIGTTMYRSWATRVQHKLIAGPLVAAYNQDLAGICARERPDVFVGYRPTHVHPATLEHIRRRTGATLAAINNDDPFSPGASRIEWRHFYAGLPLYDVHFVYRHRNLDDYRAAGASEVHLLRSFYIPGRNHPVALTEAQHRRLGHDVVFIGHYEADSRVAALEHLIESGCALRIYGPGWREVVRRSATLRRIPEPTYLDGDSYNVALNASRIALSFLSTLNRDTYTRRCFEIPASGAFLLSQYTDDLATLFDEGRDIAFFRSPSELAERAAYYLANPHERRAIADAGRERVRRDGHDVSSRMRDMMDVIAAARVR